MLVYVVVAILWVACGVAHYGLFVGFFQTKYAIIAKDTIVQDRAVAAILSVWGPVTLIAGLLYVSFQGGPWAWRL